MLPHALAACRVTVKNNGRHRPRMCQQGENSYSAPERAQEKLQSIDTLRACLENRHTITEANLLSQV
jgi:hypothetical protein